MTSAAAVNTKALMAGEKPRREATWNAVCLADFGNDGIAFIAQPQIPPRIVNWAGQGCWVHVAKVAFEKYFLRKVRKGSNEPGCERIVMKMLGIAKLHLREKTQGCKGRSSRTVFVGDDRKGRWRRPPAC